MASPQAASLGKTGKFGDLWRRLWFLLGALVVYRIGAHIPVPGIDPVKLAELFQGQQGGILGVFNLFSGGALSRFTLFALGIMPYISSSIIMQLMTISVPSMEALKKEGEAGRRKITQYTRYGTVALALFQGLGIAIALESQAGLVLDPGGLFRFVTDVAGRTDYRAWYWQRHFDHHLCWHRGRFAECAGRPVRTRSYWCDAPDFGIVHLRSGGSGHRLRGVRRKRPAQDSGELCQAPSWQ